jgi:hypothetical protein
VIRESNGVLCSFEEITICYIANETATIQSVGEFNECKRAGTVVCPCNDMYLKP